MDTTGLEHRGIEEEWMASSFAFQMGNIGSEVSRALKNFDKPKRFEGAFKRALELYDLSIECAVKKKHKGELKELCRAREEFCDYFNGNSFETNPRMMQKYYDQFAMLALKEA